LNFKFHLFSHHEFALTFFFLLNHLIGIDKIFEWGDGVDFYCEGFSLGVILGREFEVTTLFCNTALLIMKAT
jgi:hypothetical protein